MLGDKDAAIKMLASTLPLAPAHVAKIAATDPDLDPLREDPRFVALLQQLSNRTGIQQPMPVTNTLG